MQRALPAMGAYVETVRLDPVAGGRVTVVTVGDCAVALFNVDGRIYAVEDTCVRCGSSLGSGTLHGHDVTCPGCGWRYDVTTGCVMGVPALCIDTFKVEIVDATVMVATTPTPCRRGS